MAQFIPRNISAEIFDALDTSPVLLLNGARQTGKSTLAHWIAKQREFDYITLDDFTVLNAVAEDPVGFMASFERPLIIDEVQKAPPLFVTIKQLVDRDRRPGRFLLTGSANIFMLPKLSESLAGRVRIITLWPFSCDELRRTHNRFIDALFARRFPRVDGEDFSRAEWIAMMLNGGYPEVQNLPTQKHRRDWFSAYITTILQRDVKDIAQIAGLHELPRLLSLIAAQNGSLLNLSSLARDAGLVLMTLKRYVTVLEAAFLIKRVPAWFRNIGKRLIKAPKIYLTDTGLFSYLTGADAQRIQTDSRLLGQLTESWVMQELMKQASWSATRPDIYTYRSAAGQEIDFILENRSGQIVALEVKASAQVTSSDFKSLSDLKERVGPQFVRGVILYAGERTVPFGPDLLAVPLSAFWLLPKI